MVPDEQEAAWIIRMFELKADGGWQDDAICEAINAMGYGSRRSNIYDKETRQVVGQTQPKKLHPKQLNRYITRTIYCGVKCETWNQDQPVKAPFEALVSISLFNRANRGKLYIEEKNNGELAIVEDRLKWQNHRHNPEFLLRHVVTCSECQRPFVASKSKGKSGNYFGYYHCNRGHKYLGINIQEFEGTVGKYLDELKAKPSFLPLFREVVRDVWMQKNRASKADHAQINDHLSDLEKRQDALLDRIPACQSQLVQNRLEQQIEALEDNIKQVRKSLTQNTIKEDEIDAYFEIAKQMMEHPKRYIFEAQTKAKLEKLWGFIFRSCPTYQNLIDGTPDLTLIYRLGGQSDLSKSLLAGQLSCQWNTLENEIRKSV